MIKSHVIYRAIGPLALGVMAMGVVSCGDRRQEARSELSAKSFTFTVDEYMRAAREGNVTALRHFLEAGMEVDVTNADGVTALFLAAQAGRAEAVVFLVGGGANVEVTGTGYDTPLMAAARTGTVETVRALLEAKAKPEARSTRYGWTALTAAAYRGDVEIVKLLAPLSSASLDEALQLASVQGNPAVVETLLRQGADVFSRSKENRTPLMYAAANGHVDVVRLLLLNGSNKLQVDDEKLTAADLAAQNKHPEVLAALDDPRNAPPHAVEPKDTETGASGLAVAGESAAAPEAGVSGDVSTAPEATAGEAADPLVAQDGPAAVDPELAAEVPGSAPFADGDGIEGRGGGAGVSSAARGKAAGEARVEVAAAAAPPARLHGARLQGLADGSTSSVRERVRVRDYRQGQLPIVLEEVPAQGESARIRVIGKAGQAPEIVPAGGVIGDTGLELVRVERRFMDSKMGEGRPLDVSHAIVRDRSTGVRHIVRRQQAVPSSDSTALISAGSGNEVYEVQEGDEFTAGDAEPARYRVLDVRPTQVVVENLETAETVTLARSYAR
ncbi:MAG: ankyrin repeat domain-containing protein [Verrucomicrobiales bacterium]